jgi:hypothetical protein
MGAVARIGFAAQINAFARPGLIPLGDATPLAAAYDIADDKNMDLEKKQ